MLEHELEAVLSRRLGHVKAPDELNVARILAKPRLEPRARRRWRQPVAGMAAVAASAIVLLFWLRPPSSDINSTDPTQITAWLKSRSFDVPLRSNPPSSIRLTSARVRGATAEVDYRIAGRDAMLIVSPPSAGAPDPGTYHIVRSHLVRGQLFTLSCAFPQDAHTACLLCHAGGDVN